MIICKTCLKRFKEYSVNEIEEVKFSFVELLKHTKETGHHIYRVAGLKMEINIG